MEFDALKLVFNMPFRIDANGPYASALQELTTRLSRAGEVQCVTPKKRNLEPSELDAFYASRMESFAGSVVWAFDERGEELDSVALARQLEKLRDQGTRSLQLCLGAATGLPAVLARQAGLRLIRLSRMTFAHELAALVVFEQFYRAHTINSGHPYHYGAPSDLVQAKVRAADRRLN
jgi:rRNA large subunit m3Psi methyltransferase RlmH